MGNLRDVKDVHSKKISLPKIKIIKLEIDLMPGKN
jgi:hypothetical protein